MKKLIDCFTFYNELDMLELRLTELYDVADKFILVEADKTQNGAHKKYFFEENKWRYEKWIDKIIHVKVIFPEHLDTWGREKYQRNSFMPSLYSLGLSPDDIVVISDLDEIPDFNTLSYIKNSYHMKGLFKLEMDHYWGSLYNKMIAPEKWYHAKIVDWGTLKNRTPDECRIDFSCQWWENGGWHLSYFGGPDVIINKINNMAHQELNHEKFKIKEEVIKKVREAKDLFDEWRTFKKIDPVSNPYFPKNWRILAGHEEKYGIEIKQKKNLVLGAAINLEVDQIKNFIQSFRENNKKDDICILIEESSSNKKINYLKNHSVKTIFFETSKILETQPNNYRFLKFFDFLKENNQYQNILVSDVSDVYFQSDPFESLAGDFIYFAEEDESETIGSNGFNSRWIVQSFGNEALEKIKHNRILCCGTTIGSYDNMLLYCKMLSSEMIRIKNEKNPYFFDMMDQGIHNYLCYNFLNSFKNPCIKSNGDFFATIGITCIASPEKLVTKNDLLEVNGKLPKIIHQYNRSNQLTNFFNNPLASQKENNKLLETQIEGFSILTLKNDAVGKSISRGEIWEPHIVSFLRNYLNKDSVFVDIGSNYGWHSLIASELCNKVYSFEPQSLIYNLQRKSIQKNNFTNIILYNKALGNRSDSLNLAPINYDLDNLNIGDLGIGQGGENIDVITLDSLMLQKVDLIKMDVQGYEKCVIEGAVKTIENNRPIIIIEVEEFQLSKFGIASTDIFNIIRSLKYEVYLMDHTYPSDHICVPIEKVREFELKNKIEDLTENNNISNSYNNGVRKKLVKEGNSIIKEYVPVKRSYPKTIKVDSAWGDIPTILEDIIDRFNLRTDLALEFGVEWGFSTSAISNYFKEVIGVDTFTGDIHSHFKKDHYTKTSDLLKDYTNISLIKKSYQEFIKGNNRIYDLIHVDIIHDYKHTYECGEWSVNHAPVTIFHDTISFPEVMKACKDLSKNYNLEFWNYPHSNGLGILFNKNLLNKEEFTIGWVSHNKEVFEKYLGPSIKSLEGDFETIKVDSGISPASIYNQIIDKCKTKWLILCHEDVAFSSDLLFKIEETIKKDQDFNFLGFVGSGGCCNINKINRINTADSCFIIINTENKVLFDEKNFDEFHLYVEDLCVQLGEKGKTILCDYIEPEEFQSMNRNRKSWIHHGGATYSKLGSSWGRYSFYKEKINNKWGKTISTT